MSKAMTSEKQRAANARNARRSTGPRTPEGKAQSSKNATTHGIYASLAPIPRGEFVEDPVAVSAFVEAIVAGLQPRNELERAAAMRVARAFLQAARLDRLTGIEIARSSQVDAIDTPRTPLLTTGQGRERPLEEEIAASNVMVTWVQQLSVIDARVGREVERALASYRLARKIVSWSDEKEQ